MPPPAFYAVCVPLRLAIAVGVAAAGRRWPDPTAVAVLCAVAAGFAFMAYNATTRRPDAWWSRPIHAMLMAVVAATAVMALLRVPAVEAPMLGLLIGADVAFGLGHAISLEG